MFKKIIAMVLVISALFCSVCVSAFASNAVIGDVDGDGEITSTDFLKIKKYLLDSSDATEQFMLDADVNKDGTINSTDYLSIKQLWIKTDDSAVVPENVKAPTESDEFEEGVLATEPTQSEESADEDTSEFVSEPEESETSSEPEEKPEIVKSRLTVYVPDFDNNKFNTYKAYFDGTVNGLFEVLVAFDVLPEGTKVLSDNIENSIVKIDLSEEFGKAVANARAHEVLIIAAVANTVIDYFNADAIQFTVEGEILETGLNVYDSPIAFQTFITLYVPNKDYTDFVEVETFFDGTIEGLVSSLVSMNVLPKDSKVNSFALNGKTAKIDLSEEFGEGLNEARSFELMIVGSLANTIIEYYNVEEVCFTVDGDILETGLNVYDSPISFQKLITLYAPDEAYANFVEIKQFFDGTIEDIVDSLAALGAIPENSKVYSFSANGKTAKIDLSKEFGVGVNEARGGEVMVVGSLANTIIRYYGVEEVAFTVEGEILETGLNVYDSPISFQTLITLYAHDENYKDFVEIKKYFDGTIEGLVDSLVSINVLPEGSKVISFDIKGKTAKIDLSEEFGVGLNEARSGELMIVGSLANTIIKYYNVNEISFTVEGEILETGLNVYDSPISFQDFVIFYIPNETKSGLKEIEGYCNGTAEGIVASLVAMDALPANSEVISFSIVENVAKIDFSGEFGIGLNEARTSELTMVASLVNTIIRYYGTNSVQFTVEGEILETGLNVYDSPIEFIV